MLTEGPQFCPARRTPDTQVICECGAPFPLRLFLTACWPHTEVCCPSCSRLLHVAHAAA